MADTTAGTLIDGRYKVLSRLGAGGMADVYLAEDQQLGRKVALKLLHRRFAEDPGFVERFRREAQAAAGLQHPNVVSVYDRGTYDDTYYIAMEYLPGRTLKQLIRQDAPLDPVRAIDLAIQILKAARFAHRRGVIHRDLKPHNVIVDDTDHAKVTDFGIARAGASDMTETGSIMGTAQYLSPEQAQGHAVSAGSDLYSVGVILYEMLTGRVPFDAEAAVTIAIKHVSEAPLAPTAINPAMPPELEQVILWALNKNPADRPTDAEQLIEALEQVKALIVSGNKGERTTSFAAVAAAQAYQTAQASAVPPTAISDTAPPAPVPYFGDGTGHYTIPPQQRRRRPWWFWALIALAVLLALGGAAAAYVLTRPEKVAVPTVVLENVNPAQATIQNAGLTPSLITRTDSHRAGTVIAQSPLGGVKVNKGSTVTLTVSQGPGTTTVPSVVGLSLKAAKQELKQSGLVVRATQSETSDAVPSGQATRTDPQAGTTFPVGGSVTLFMSSGKPKINVPDVTGETQAAATSNLKSAGFTVSSSTSTSTTVQAGTVISQNPAGGSSALSGSNVSIVVAQAPPKVNVPDVVGKKPNAATNALKSAGFTVSQQSQNVTDPAQAGVVISENPSAGSSQTKGSNVTIVVGQFTPPTSSTTTSSTPTSSTSTTTSK